MRKYTILGGYGLLALVLDQLTKWWAPSIPCSP